jgi:hypothetical protein
MALQTKQGVIAIHPNAIIGDAHQAAPACLNFDIDPCSLRVESILDQFLGDAGGAFDNFSGGDLIGYLLGQKTNAIHGDYFARGSPNENIAPPVAALRARIQPW